MTAIQPEGENSSQSEVQKAALDYIQRGYKPIPVHYLKKRPILKAWQDLRLTEEDVPDYFGSKKQNIGLLCGEASGELADVDCDAAEAIAAAPVFLPKTEMRSGRKSKPNSHYWLIGTGDTLRKTVQFEDVPHEGETEGAMLVELRFTGGQTLVPPSVHPSGEPYVWYGPQEPASIDGGELLHAVQRIAACALLARHWRAQGTRHKVGLALAGFLLRGGMSEEEAEHLICVAAKIAGHQDVADRTQTVQSTRERLEAGEPVTGYTTLKEYLPERVIKKLADWLGLKQPGSKAKSKAARSDSEEDEEERSLSAAQRLIALGQQTERFHSDMDEPFVRLEVNGHKEIWSIRSKAFRTWLARQFYLETGKAASGEAMQNALSVLEGDARFDGVERPLALRCARDADGVLWIDLSNKEWQAVKVTPNGWEVVSDPPPLFRRYAFANAHSIPQQGGSLDRLRDFLNVRDEAGWRLLIVWLVAALIPEIAHTILVIHGEQGSAKSTLLRLLAQLVDPTKTPLRCEPRDKPAWIQAAAHSWLVGLDNVSHLPLWLSDALCRAVSGEADSKRELYTNDEDVIYCFRRVLALTGIEVVVQRPDVLERSILLELQPIPPANRLSETDVLQNFDEARPYLFGALLDLLSGALRELPDVSRTNLPRMADFARIGMAVECVLGWPEDAFMQAYSGTIASQHEEAIAASLVGEAIVAFMSDESHLGVQTLEGSAWQGTAQELLKLLTVEVGETKARYKEWPKSPKDLSGQLRRIAPNLRAIGVEIAFATAHRGRLITLTRTETFSTVATVAP